MSFDKELVGVAIDSKQIVESLRQILALVELGLKSIPDYNKLPNKIPEAIQNI